MVWGCVSSKGFGVIRILIEIMTKEVYLDILKNELTASIKKFGYIYYQDNDAKHKSYLCRSWLYSNCTEVIDEVAKERSFKVRSRLWIS